MKAAVIQGRLAANYGFIGNRQRVKLHVQKARPRCLGTRHQSEGTHRHAPAVRSHPRAHAQVDWGDEGRILAYLETFLNCHRRAFDRVVGVPMTIALRPHEDCRTPPRCSGRAVPSYPEAVGFADFYDFDVLVALRPTCKGRVEWQVSDPR